MSIELKIKSKHLALEPAIIRKEEYKIRKQMRHYKMYHQLTGDIYECKDQGLFKLHDEWKSLHNHRKWNVRNEARATYLARAYIKGIPYETVEKTRDEWFIKAHIMPRVIDMVAKYGSDKIYKYHTPNGKQQYRPEEYTALLTKLYKWANIE